MMQPENLLRWAVGGIAAALALPARRLGAFMDEADAVWMQGPFLDDLVA